MREKTKKKTVARTFRIDETLAEKLQQTSEQTSISQNMIVQDAIRCYLSKSSPRFNVA